VIALEQNYRSTGHILRAANAVIAHNPKIFEKKLWSEFGDGEPGARAGMRRRGARGRARRGAHPGLRAPGRCLKFGDFAILYRANHQARVFEQKLRAAQIPYKVSGGQSYFDRAEIKDLCAWLRLLVNPDDDPAFLRAVTTPKRGIGHQTLASAGRVRRQVEAEPVRGAVLAQPGQQAQGQGDRARCRSSAASSTTWSTAPATPPGPRMPRRCCWAG
jgi:ATP-dependent DNA helicase Rep